MTPRYDISACNLLLLLLKVLVRLIAELPLLQCAVKVTALVAKAQFWQTLDWQLHLAK